MSGFPILDLVIGLIFIFFILSIISSAIVEVIMTRLKYRNKILTRWLMTIFEKKMIQPDGKVVKLGQAIMDHCLTTALSKEGEATSFMDAKNFVSALIEKLTFNPDNPTDIVQDLGQLIGCIKNAKAIDGTTLLSTELQRTILIFGSEANILAPPSIAGSPGNVTGAVTPDAKNSFEIFRGKMENWFDTSMDRIGGEMKRRYTRPVTFWVAAAVVIGLNVDTVQISKYLYDHKDETRLFADRATAVVKSYESRVEALKNKTDTAGVATMQESITQINGDIDSLKKTVPQGMPLGWNNGAKEKIGIQKIIGWLATIMAIMLGAPFWFDMLNKLANIRGSGTKPASSTDEPQEETKKK